MKQDDLLWLAGLLEGEGSFMKGCPSKPNSPIISCKMIDEDIIYRVANLFGVSYCKRLISKKNPKWKDIYMTQLRGMRAMSIMKQLKPLMGKRRQQQIQNALDSFNPDSYIIKLSKNDVYKIKKMLNYKQTHEKIAQMFNVSRATITDINIGKTWKYIKCPRSRPQ